MGNEVDVADQLCAAFASLQGYLPAMEGLQFGTMRHADDGGVGQFIDHRLHHPRRQ